MYMWYVFKVEANAMYISIYKIYSWVNKIVFFNVCETVHIKIGKSRQISQLTTSIIVRQFIHSSMTSMLCMHLLNHTKMNYRWKLLYDWLKFITEWKHHDNWYRWIPRKTVFHLFLLYRQGIYINTGERNKHF